MSLKKRLRKKKWNRKLIRLFIVLLLFMVGFIAYTGTYFDLRFGKDIIRPTSISRDIWGNYKIHFDSDMASNDRFEGFYYIDANQSWLAGEVNDAIKSNRDIVIYYDSYIGWKGLMAPETSPIIMVKIIDQNDLDGYNRKIKKGQ